MKNNDTTIIPPHGNYRELLSYRKAEIVYDLTFRFCERYLKKSDRTIDQMVQAARSGKQNIIEGCAASGTSKEMELKLAKQLIDQGTNEKFEPEKYKDTVRERVLEAIEGKVEGQEITAEPAEGS